MEFEVIANSPWVHTKLVGNLEYESYRLGSIDRRAYLKKMVAIARDYAGAHLGIENTETASVNCRWALSIDPDKGVGFEILLTPKDTATYRASMNPHTIFLPADYAFATVQERAAMDDAAKANRAGNFVI